MAIRCGTLIAPRPGTMTDPTIVLRARAEYLEMPGLRLTLPQASRLFDLRQDICALLLETLVVDGFLSRTGDR